MKTSLDSLKRAGLMVCFLFSLGLTIHAQHWALPSSHWEYVTYYCGFNAPCADYFSDDMVVNGTVPIGGQMCASVINTLHPYWSPFYTYSSGDTAYFWQDSIFRPMYYFGANTGDTLRFYDHLDTSSYLYVVDSVSPMLVSGDTLRKVSVHSPQFSWGTFEYADRIGLIGGIAPGFYPTLRYVVDASRVRLCNYGDNTITSYWLYPSRSCETTKVDDIAGTSFQLHAYPNPSTGTFTIDLPMPGEKLLHIYDIAGREVLNQAVSDQQLTARLTVAGMYMVEVQQGQSRYRSKVVVQ